MSRDTPETVLAAPRVHQLAAHHYRSPATEAVNSRSPGGVKASSMPSMGPDIARWPYSLPESPRFGLVLWFQSSLRRSVLCEG